MYIGKKSDYRTLWLKVIGKVGGLGWGNLPPNFPITFNQRVFRRKYMVSIVWNRLIIWIFIFLNLTWAWNLRELAIWTFNFGFSIRENSFSPVRTKSGFYYFMILLESFSVLVWACVRCTKSKHYTWKFALCQTTLKAPSCPHVLT